MELILRNKVITAEIPEILQEVKKECGNRYLNYIGNVKGDSVKITCPWHKNGQESKPSCFVYAKRDNKDVYYGTCHCFTCGKAVPLYTLIGYCMGEDDEFGKQWLIDNFGNIIEEDYLNLKEINLNIDKKEYLDENILEKYNQYHPYMTQRKLTPEILRKFKIGYNSETNSITFPVWDEHGKLVMITERSVNTKHFYIPKDVIKPVYLLNFIKKENITTVYVTESQINALTLWSWGYPAVALIGTGTLHQYEILKKSGIRNYILCLDGDEAGDKGINRFNKNMPKNIFISTKLIPRWKDVNDLTKEEFDNLPLI